MKAGDYIHKSILKEKNVMPYAKNILDDATLPKRVFATNTLEKDKVQMQNEPSPRKKRLESMSDEEIIEENLKELLEKKNHEDRQANGRRIAIVVALLLIFMAVYHAWIRKSAMLAGALVPAFIMLIYGGWVVILAKKDKKRRALFQKQIEEIAQKNKEVLQKKAKLKKRKREKKAKDNATMMHIVNELRATSQPKRPSIRQKLFRQNSPTSLTTSTNIHELATTSLFSPALAIGTSVDLTPHVITNLKIPTPSTKIINNLEKGTNKSTTQTSGTPTIISPLGGLFLTP